MKRVCESAGRLGDADPAGAYEIMLVPANATLHRYIKDLAHVSMEPALKMAKEDEVVKKLEIRVEGEQEVASS